MLTEAKLKRLTGVVDPATGILWALSEDGSPPIAVTYPNGVNLDFRNVVNASLMMYRVLSDTETVFAALHDYFVDNGLEELIEPVTNAEVTIRLARRCAIEGLEKINARREKRD
jgi:hypothetical protein